MVVATISLDWADRTTLVLSGRLAYYAGVPVEESRRLECVGGVVRRYVQGDMFFLVSDRRPDALERALEWLVSEEDR